jgi:hypothetical protein
MNNIFHHSSYFATKELLELLLILRYLGDIGLQGAGHPHSPVEPVGNYNMPFNERFCIKDICIARLMCYFKLEPK